MSTSPFMDDYSSEDYSDHDDDYSIVSAPTLSEHVRGQVEIRTQSNDLQNLIMGPQVDVNESVYFDVLPKLEAQTAEEEGGCMEQSIYLRMESYFDLEVEAKFGIAATGVVVVLETETAVEELAVGSYFDLDAHVETGLPAALDTKIVLKEIDVIESKSSETMEVDTVSKIVESRIEEFMFEVEESKSDLEAEDVIEEPNSNVHHAVDVGTEAETVVEEGDVIGGSIYEGVESDYDLDAIEGDVISGSIYKAVGLDYDFDAVEEGDVINESIYEDMGSNYDLDVDEEGDVIGEPIYEDVGSDYDLDVDEEGDAIGDSNMDYSTCDRTKENEEECSDMDPKDNFDVNCSASDRTEEDVEEYSDTDPIDDFDVDCSTFDRMEEDAKEYSDTDPKDDSDVDCSASDQTEGDGDEYSNTVVDCSASDWTEEDAEEYSDRDPKDDTDVDCSAFEQIEEDGDEYSDTDPKEDSDVDCSAFDWTEEDVEEYFDTDPKDNSDVDCSAFDQTEEDVEEYSDLNSKDDSYMDSSDFDRTEEEEDDVVVSYLKSSTSIQNKAWKSLVPAWAKLLVTDIPTLEDSSLLESFLGRGPMLMLQECGNAVMNVIETLLCELSRIRNDLCRVLGALFR